MVGVLPSRAETRRRGCPRLLAFAPLTDIARRRHRRSDIWCEASSVANLDWNEAVSLASRAALASAVAAASDPIAAASILADRCAVLAAASGRRIVVGLAGGPGSGKSTLAVRVAEVLTERGVPAAVLPMDGFHYTRAELAAGVAGDPGEAMARRGAARRSAGVVVC